MGKLGTDLVCGLALALALLCCAEAWPLPVPPHRPPPVRNLEGRWLASWSGSEWRTWLLPDGAYIAEGKSSRWTGTWRIQGDTLHISERCDGAYGEYHAHAWRLKRGRNESVCGTLVLRPW